MTTVFAAMSPRRWQFSVKAQAESPTLKLPIDRSAYALGLSLVVIVFYAQR